MKKLPGNTLSGVNSRKLFYLWNISVLCYWLHRMIFPGCGLLLRHFSSCLAGRIPCSSRVAACFSDTSPHTWQAAPPAFPGLRPASPTLLLMPGRPHHLLFPGCGLLLRHFSSCLAGRITCFSRGAACFSDGLTLAWQAAFLVLPGLRPASPSLLLMPGRPQHLLFPGCGLLLRHFSSCLAGRITCFSRGAACFSDAIPHAWQAASLAFPGMRPASPSLLLMPGRPHHLLFPECGLLLRHFSSCLAGRNTCFSRGAACFSVTSPHAWQAATLAFP